LSLPSLLVAQEGGRRLPNHTPRFIPHATNLGAEDPGRTLSLTVWLRVHNRSELDALVERLYDKDSPDYHQWLTSERFASEFGPTAAEAGIVNQFLTERGLTVTAVHRNNLFVRATGTVAQVQKAFSTPINRFDLDGAIHHANTSDPLVSGPAGALVAAVGGLADYSFKPHSVRPIEPATGKVVAATPLSPSPNGAFFAANCFRAPEFQAFFTGGGLPASAYFGNRYGADITNDLPGTLPPCGYQPSDVQKAYHLNNLYSAGLDGTGQSVVIVDAFGSPTIAYDSSVFASFYGLAALNLNVYYSDGVPAVQDTGWATETTLDVEWAHSVAPGATINLVVAPTNSFVDLDNAIIFAIDNNLGNVISNSYGAPESLIDSGTLDATNFIMEVAAAFGISAHFSSGDDGDFTPFLPYPYAPTAGFPASSPFVTGVGGTSLALGKGGEKLFETGWGTNLTRIASPGGAPAVPPVPFGFQFGAGGGQSDYFPKPRFQEGIRGRGRQTPDISWLADPYTGVEMICDGGSCGTGTPGILYADVIGGTSLACPMFSGLWSIAQQKAGGPLGQAARKLYHLRGGVHDVLPVGSDFDVQGITETLSGPTYYSPWELAAPLGVTHRFFSALYNSPFSTSWFVVTFGTDSSTLATTRGWDNVTGVGTPRGRPFVEEVTRP
jgi:subtilase family serine protease